MKKKWLRPFCYSLEIENIITIESFQVQVHGIYLKKNSSWFNRGNKTPNKARL